MHVESPDAVTFCNVVLLMCLPQLQTKYVYFILEIVCLK